MSPSSTVRPKMAARVASENSVEDSVISGYSAAEDIHAFSAFRLETLIELVRIRKGQPKWPGIALFAQTRAKRFSNMQN
ncbi:hypothetical protein XH94_02970 [Bradyrhizobium zhanjiangense]|uniref:Uncharacterized protein n=1 Tax=Bradyrhizobium zhanjiangense TaxID=1325107 RepID=A0A4V1L4Q9_9BRAD|nr:hypothetical protein XH94_02970 [Bradyrhizobium zhanjiangense]